jgi:hypothetical protein
VAATLVLGIAAPTAAADITWTDFSGWTPYDLGPGDVTLCDGKTVTIEVTGPTTPYVQTDGQTVGYPFFTEEHGLFANVNDIDFLRFRTRAASAVANFSNAAPNSYTMTWTFSPPLDHMNFFTVGQLLQGNVATITASDPAATVVNNGLGFEQLKAEKSGTTFYESLSWTPATGVLEKAATTGSNSQYGFFSIPNGTDVEKVVIELADDGIRGNVADEVNYGIGCVQVEVEINIKPGSDPNSINTCAGGTTPVTIWGSASFDVTTVDIDQLVLASAAVKTVGKSDRSLCSTEDVGAPDPAFFDGLDPTPDGYLDLTCHFITVGLTALDDSSSSADLSITGCDTPADGCSSGDPGYYQFTASDAVNIVKDCE